MALLVGVVELGRNPAGGADGVTEAALAYALNAGAGAMAKIAIAATSSNNTDVAGVRGVTGLSLAEVKKRLATGAALFEGDYYVNPEEMPRQIRALVGTLQRAGIDPEVYELGDDEELAQLSDEQKAARRITTTSLESRLARFEQVGEEQRQQMAEEAEDKR